MGRRANRGSGGRVRLVVGLIVAGCVISGCGVGGPFAPSPAGPVSTPVASATATDQVFELRISTPDARPAPNEPITIATTVAYLGPEPTATVAGAAGGLVGFELVDVDHDVSVGPVMDAACKPYAMTRGVAAPFRFEKSGAYTDGTPGEDLARWYLSDPVLRLPAGRWRIVAHLTAYVGECTLGGAHELSAAVELAVAS